MEERDWLQHIRGLDSQTKQVGALEELARGLGYAVDAERNQLKNILQKSAGVIVNEEKIFELAKLYLGYGLYAPGATALPLADVALYQNFSCDQLFESILSQIAPGAFDPGVSPMQNVLVAVRGMQQIKASKPSIGVALVITHAVDAEEPEWLHFFGGLRMLLTMRDLKLVVLCSKFEEVPDSLAKMIPICSAGFSL